LKGNHVLKNKEKTALFIYVNKGQVTQIDIILSDITQYGIVNISKALKTGKILS
jgi:hypothetical protein